MRLGTTKWNQSKELQELLTGNYVEAEEHCQFDSVSYTTDGGAADRSVAEYHMAEKLAWLLDDDKNVVNHVIMRYCNEQSFTSDGQRRK